MNGFDFDPRDTTENGNESENIRMAIKSVAQRQRNGQALDPAIEHAKLHTLMDKMDKWEAAGLDQWGLSPVRWDIIR